MYGSEWPCPSGSVIFVFMLSSSFFLFWDIFDSFQFHVHRHSIVYRQKFRNRNEHTQKKLKTAQITLMANKETNKPEPHQKPIDLLILVCIFLALVNVFLWYRYNRKLSEEAGSSHQRTISTSKE